MSRRDALRRIGIGLAAVGVAAVARPEEAEAAKPTCEERCTEECPNSTAACVEACTSCRKSCKKKKTAKKRKKCIKKCLGAPCPTPVCVEDATCGPNGAGPRVSVCTCRRDTDGELFCSEAAPCGPCSSGNVYPGDARCVPPTTSGFGTCFVECGDVCPASG
jgi:hypothetical protein